MAPGRSNAGTNRDNPRVAGDGDFWRRWMYRLGYRHSVFGDEDAGITPPTGGVGSTYFLAADGTWSVPAGSGGVNQLTGDVTAGPGSGSQAATIANSAVTLAKIANASASSVLLGSGDSGSGSAYTQITLGSGLTMTGTELSATGGGGLPPNDDYGDVTVTDDGATWTIDNTAVTLAKIQNGVTKQTVLGVGEFGVGSSYSELTLGSGLQIAGTVLSAPGIATNTADIATNAVDIAANTADIAGKQPLDSDLTAIAALTTATTGRSLLTASDKAAIAAITKSPYVVEQLTSGSEVGASSTAYQSMFSFTIPANSLGTHGRAVIAYEIEAHVEAGLTKGRWRINGTDVFRAQNSQPPSDSAIRRIVGDCAFVSNGSTSAQTGSFRASLTDQGTTAGIGGWLLDDARMAGSFAATSVDSTSAITIELQIQFLTSNALNYFKRLSARLMIEPTV